QVLEALVRIPRRAEARELAHGPWPRPVHGGLRAPGVGVLPREADVAEVVLPGSVRGREHVGDGNPRVGGEALLAELHPAERGGELLLLPPLLRLLDLPQRLGVVGWSLRLERLGRQLGGRLA